MSKVAAVPVVFNNLGVLYAELNDKSRAINAFREALARDLDYRPVRSNLDRMKDVMALGADPVSREVEPNNNMTVANIIAPGKPVEGEIEAAVNDVDFFRVTTPPAPRDLISIEITNRSTTLAPVLKIFDDERTDHGHGARPCGSRAPSLQQIIRPAAERDAVRAGFGLRQQRRRLHAAGAAAEILRQLRAQRRHLQCAADRAGHGHLGPALWMRTTRTTSRS